MLSKNNYKEKIRKMEPRKERFSIRKFSIGAASVLIGFSFMSMAGSQKAHAATGDQAAVVQNAKNNEESANVQKNTENAQNNMEGG
ncbi:YSIRK-type signal peptide-containing protein [Lactobacillus johnsonii]